MILQELHEYYQRLVKDPATDVPQQFWSKEKAAWEIGLNADGTVAYADPLITGEGKEARKFIQMQVPEHPVRSGSGVSPFFLCDNPAYLFGMDEKRGAKKRAASGDLHRSVLKDVEDEGAQAIVRFFEIEDPASALREDVRKALSDSGGFAVFRLKGDVGRIHERPAIIDAWKVYRAQPSEDAIIGQCSITGKRESLARLFPQVTGIPGAQSAGASLVSFNQKSFDSYGKSQAFNAAVSESVAFNAGSALKYLFDDQSHRIWCGKVMIVFWSDRPAPKEDAIVRTLMDMVPLSKKRQVAEDGEAVADIGYALKRMRQGLPLSECDPDVRYFILGINPNAARLAVQFFEESSFGQLEEHFREYLDDIALDGVELCPLALLLRQTAARGSAEDVPSPLLYGCMQAMLSGSRFPRALLGLLLTRMRADHGSVNSWDMGQRAALMKAYLVRSRRLASKECDIEEKGSLSMTLERGKTDRGYVLGRLFAVMERAQTAAINEVNATIKDRYIGSASSTPRRVYPSLLSNLKNHIAKLRKANAGLCIVLEKETDKIMDLIEGEAFPPSLSMEEQGEFYVGYHQERCFLWKSKEERAQEEAASDTTIENEG